MNTTLTLDKAGRVVLPKPLREELRLEPGDKLELDAEGEKLTLRPLRAGTALRKERGIWVLRRGTKMPAMVTDRVIRNLRKKHNPRNASGCP